MAKKRGHAKKWMVYGLHCNHHKDKKVSPFKDINDLNFILFFLVQRRVDKNTDGDARWKLDTKR